MLSLMDQEFKGPHDVVDWLLDAGDCLWIQFHLVSLDLHSIDMVDIMVPDRLGRLLDNGNGLEIRLGFRRVLEHHGQVIIQDAFNV